MRERTEERDVECDQCGYSYIAAGRYYGEGWNEPREWEPYDSHAQCPRCETDEQGSRRFTIEFTVVGFEDFSKLTAAKDWEDYFDSFDNVFLQHIEIKEIKHDD